MVGVIVCLYKLFLAFVQAVWLYFTEYIEYADAIMSGLIIRSYALEWGLNDTISTVLAVAAGIAFLVIFKTSKIGWYIMTAMFSYGWAEVIASIVRDIFNLHFVLYLLITVGLTAHFAWLHYYALDRAETHQRCKEQEYAKKHPRKEPTVSVAQLKSMQDMIDAAANKK